MLKIKKSTRTAPQGAHWHMGADFMRPISEKTARALCGMYPLPRMGHETVCAVAPTGYGGRFALRVQNVSGDFWLSCESVPVARWPAVFRVEITA